MGVMTAISAAPVTLEFPLQTAVSGETQSRLERAYTRVCAPPLDDLDFVLSDVHFKFVRRFTEYSGDISGRLLGALNAASPLVAQETPLLSQLCAAFPKLQKPDGHFGADQDLAHSVDQARDMPILWGNGRLLLAMAECLRRHPDPALLDSAKKLGDYVISTHPYYGRRENFEKVGGSFASGFTTCYPSLMDGLAALYEVTGEAKYLDEARFIADLSLLDQEFAEHHSHGRLVAYRGMLDLDRITGARDFTKAVVAACKQISDALLLPTGGVTEMFDRAYIRDEGCSEADWIRVNLLLWRATRDTAYLDSAEHALRNHLLAVQISNGGFGHHTFRPVKQDSESFPAGYLAGYVSDSYWCCSMHAAQLLAELPSWGIMTSENKVLVTWLAEGKTTLKWGNKEVHVTATKNGPVTWKIRSEAPDTTEVALRLRVPGWADTINVDGKTLASKSGWAEAICKSAKELEVTFPDEIRLRDPYTGTRTTNAPARVFAGPDLFCLPDACLDDGFLANDMLPEIVIAADRPQNSVIPVLVRGAGGGLQHARLVPIADRPLGGCRFLFGVQKVDADQYAALDKNAAPERHPGKSIEILFASDKDYTCYVNGRQIFHNAGWAESPRVTALLDRPENVIAVQTPSNLSHPGLIGMIEAEGKRFVTRPEDWTAVFCSKTPPAEWLADPATEIKGAIAPKDIGPFGMPPWNHVPGQFASTGARWIWPAGTPGDGQSSCLFRYLLKMDSTTFF